MIDLSRYLSKGVGFNPIGSIQTFGKHCYETIFTTTGSEEQVWQLCGVPNFDLASYPDAPRYYTLQNYYPTTRIDLSGAFGGSAVGVACFYKGKYIVVRGNQVGQIFCNVFNTDGTLEFLRPINVYVGTASLTMYDIEVVGETIYVIDNQDNFWSFSIDMVLETVTIITPATLLPISTSRVPQGLVYFEKLNGFVVWDSTLYHVFDSNFTFLYSYETGSDFANTDDGMIDWNGYIAMGDGGNTHIIITNSNYQITRQINSIYETVTSNSVSLFLDRQNSQLIRYDDGTKELILSEVRLAVGSMVSYTDNGSSETNSLPQYIRIK
jgi:hypothetical protein